MPGDVKGRRRGVGHDRGDNRNPSANAIYRVQGGSRGAIGSSGGFYPERVALARLNPNIGRSARREDDRIGVQGVPGVVGVGRKRGGRVRLVGEYAAEAQGPSRLVEELELGQWGQKDGSLGMARKC